MRQIRIASGVAVGEPSVSSRSLPGRRQNFKHNSTRARSTANSDSRRFRLVPNHASSQNLWIQTLTCDSRHPEHAFRPCKSSNHGSARFWLRPHRFTLGRVLLLSTTNPRSSSEPTCRRGCQCWNTTLLPLGRWSSPSWNQRRCELDTCTTTAKRVQASCRNQAGELWWWISRRYRRAWRLVLVHPGSMPTIPCHNKVDSGYDARAAGENDYTSS